MQSGNSHLFMDISTISYKDTNISFSVENLLNSEYYPSKAQRPEQKSDKNKNKEKGTKTISDKNKKDAPTTPRKTSNCALKDIKRSKRQMSKKQEVLEQRDTQDNSQTVKKVANKSNHKQMLIKNVAKSIESIGVVKSILSSNKFQPKLEGHYRTKSNGSFKKTKSGGTFNCRSDFQGKTISSNISLKHNQSNSKQRSGTIREITDDAKIKNQNIVRNDYFEETQKNGRVLSKIIGNIIRQRSLSASKKDIKGLKKPKKIDQIIPTTITSNEKFNPRSPKLRKK